MNKAPVCWEGMYTYNPAAVVMGNEICVLYRAQDSVAKGKVGGGLTSRLGLATSRDGIHFERNPEPVFYPDHDRQKCREWKGGCEDPRLVRTTEGKFVLTYTQYNRVLPRMAVATSDDLKHWVKHGSAFKGYPGWVNRVTKSGSIICEIVNGELRAAKIKGKYYMYVGEKKLRLASSTDLLHWRPGKVVYKPRKGKYDSQLTEAGPPAVITDKGVVLLYNGKNRGVDGDTTLGPGAYSVGQLLFDKNDLSHLLRATDQPCFAPREPFERTGFYAAGTTFAEGLVLFKGQWFLYYGCADSFVGVAVSGK